MPQAKKRYPPVPMPFQEIDRGYQDVAAVELYMECGGGKLVGALKSAHQALQSQTAKLEEFYNTPFSEDHAKLISVTVEAIEKIELQIERWHYLIYPNQRGDNGKV